PGTAMVSVVIVMMHQQSGMVIARGFYRGLGMVCGSLAGLVLIAWFAQQPLLFFIALAAWIGACVFGASYYRNFQSYGFVLTGY
ncbi:FUSC family protein, partial [Paraburkholderia sp. SIMBA_049]